MRSSAPRFGSERDYSHPPSPVMIPEYSFLGALKWWLTASSNEAELAMGQAVSPAGQRVGLTMVAFLTRARCETAEATQIPAALRAYLVGQAVILHCELEQTPVAPAGRKVQTRPRAPQLFTGGKKVRRRFFEVHLKRPTIRGHVNLVAGSRDQRVAREAGGGVAGSAGAHGSQRAGRRAHLADSTTVEEVARGLTLCEAEKRQPRATRHRRGGRKRTQKRKVGSQVYPPEHDA